MKFNSFVRWTSVVLMSLLCGCAGFSIPQPMQNKPITYFRGGDQLGRDQLANRMIVANHKYPIVGKHANEVLTFLGQPQEVKITQRDVSEDWYFVYYKKYIPYNPAKKVLNDPELGTFVIRFEHKKVIEVVNLP